MRVSVRDVFRTYYEAQAENDRKMKESFANGGNDSFEGYGKLLAKRNDLHTLLSKCELKVDIPKHLEYIFNE